MADGHRAACTRGVCQLTDKAQVVVRDRQQRLQATLRELVQRPGVLGAALVSRDGIRGLDSWKRDMWNRETFSAMSATLIGAAEIALGDPGAVATRRVIAETDNMKLIVVGASDELLLTALAEASAPLEDFLGYVEHAAQAVAAILIGG